MTKYILGGLGLLLISSFIVYGLTTAPERRAARQAAESSATLSTAPAGRPAESSELSQTGASDEAVMRAFLETAQSPVNPDQSLREELE